MRTKYVQYYVEGDDEEKLVNVLKNELRVIRPGKVQKMNVVQNEFNEMRLRPLLPGTMAVLIFDVDAGSPDTLRENIKILEKYSRISEVVTIPQVRKLEDELIRSCGLKSITELLNSKSRSEFKSDIIKVSNLAKKLQAHGFDINKFWVSRATPPYEGIVNQSDKVKIR
jgi:hypothetical protein